MREDPLSAQSGRAVNDLGIDPLSIWHEERVADLRADRAGRSLICRRHRRTGRGCADPANPEAVARRRLDLDGTGCRRQSASMRWGLQSKAGNHSQSVAHRLRRWFQAELNSCRTCWFLNAPRPPFAAGLVRRGLDIVYRANSGNPALAAADRIGIWAGYARQMPLLRDGCLPLAETALRLAGEASSRTPHTVPAMSSGDRRPTKALPERAGGKGRKLNCSLSALRAGSLSITSRRGA